MILQCVEASGQYITMNEYQTASFHDSNCFGRETGYLDSGSKEIYVLHESSRDIGPPPSEAKGRAECWTAKVMDEFPLNNDNVMVNSQRKADQNALSHWERHEDSLSSVTYDKNSEPRQEEQENLMTMEDYTHNKSGLSDSIFSPSVLMEENLTVNEPIVDCSLPELEVCYKEINHHTVKDICIDEGRHEDRILLESVENDISEHFVPGNPNENNNCSASEVGIDTEVHMSEITETPLLKNMNDSADRCASKEQVIREETRGTTDKVTTANNSLEDSSLMDSRLPILDLNAQSSNESLPNPFDDEVRGVEQLLHQIPNRHEVSEDDTCPGGLLNNTKEDRGSSSSNLDSPVQFTAYETVVGDRKEHPFDSGNVHELKDNVPGNILDAERVPNIHENDLEMMDGNSDGSSVAPRVNGKDESTEMVHEQCNKDRDDNSAHLSRDSNVHPTIDQNQSLTPHDPQKVEPNDSQKEHKNFDNTSLLSHLENDRGETSFSAASLIAYSGPIIAPGSISNRSDSSATSARSFAFPILQSEWNSSPVRMKKADRRRKHNFCLSVARCCGF